MKAWLTLTPLINWLRRHFKTARADKNGYAASVSWEVFSYNFEVNFFTWKVEDEIQEK